MRLCETVADVDSIAKEPRGERLDVLVIDDEGESAARGALTGLPVRFHRIPFGDIWVRDTGPAFIVSAGELGAACFGFNGWGGKYLFAHDPEVAARIAEAASATDFHFPWVFESGAIDVDGEGTALATRQCLLNPNRGANLDEETVERRLRDALGIDKVVWLDAGLPGDHTDGHVDMVARFTAPGTVLCMEPGDSTDPSRQALRSALESLTRSRDARGRALEVVRVPSPGRVEDARGAPMPASYANFYIANTTVVVPGYGSPRDRDAVSALEALFPDRRIVAIEARAVLAGGGAFHCITREQPRHPGAE